MSIRPETPADIADIDALTRAAFQPYPGHGAPEVSILEALRRDHALALSLVAVEGSALIGHVAFSPVSIDGVAGAWLGLGPVSVRPDRQKAGIGRRLIDDGLAALVARGAAGCVVLGDPDYYRRFGFIFGAALTYAPADPEHFGMRILAGPPAAGAVEYHPSFLEA